MSVPRRLILLPCLLVPATAGLAESASPVAVSPGASQAALAAASACPTFSWSLPARSRAEIELAIFALAEGGSLAARPTLSATLPAGTSSWTPSADRCLPAGQYAWTLRERGSEDNEPDWGAPRFFRVEQSPVSELERTVEAVLERWLAEHRSAAGVGSEPRPRALAERRRGSHQGPRSIAAAASYDPPDCTGAQMFTDVPNADARCQFIEQIANDGISTGCTVAGIGGPFCPDDPVTRGQLAALLVRAMRGSPSWDPQPDVTRAISVPLTAFVDCEAPGGYISYTDGVGSAPQFLHTGSTHGPVIEFDAAFGDTDFGHTICTRLVVPPDYVAGSELTFTALADVITPGGNIETLIGGLTRTDGTFSSCTTLLTTSGGITEETCPIDGTGFAPGMSLNFQITPATVFGVMDDGVQVHAVELRYTAVQ